MNQVIDEYGLEDVPEADKAEPSRTYATIRLMDLKAPSPDDGRELIKDRFLNRAGSLLFVGPTGSGKSSFAMQAGILWSIGKPCFGLRANGPLRILYVQAEDDEGDLYEIRNGIFEGLNLSPSEVDKAGDNFHIATVDHLVTVNDSVGQLFIANVLRPLLCEFKPDLLILNPLLAYAGCDIGRQELLSVFVRTGLQPAIAEANCGLMLVTHPPKPKQDNGEQKAGEDAYYASGSADLANWARAIMVLKATAHHGLYKLRIPKRGLRAGWAGDDGTPAFERTIAWGKGGLIYWREADVSEEFTPANANTGKADVLALVPATEPIDKDCLISKAKTVKDIGRDRTKGIIAELIAEGRLWEWRIRRAGTNPKKALARDPQPTPKTPE